MGNYNVIDPELGEFNEHQAPSDHLIILWTSSMLACGFTEVPCNVCERPQARWRQILTSFSPLVFGLPPFRRFSSFICCLPNESIIVVAVTTTFYGRPQSETNLNQIYMC